MKIPFFSNFKTQSINNIPATPASLDKIEKKILVAEDIEINQMLVKNLLEEWGCNVDIAVNGLEAVKKVKETDYDLILMDIQMPVMDGITATHEIRNLPQPGKENVMIMAFTSIDFKDVNKYIEAGMDDYIIKPYTKENLHEKIVNILKKQNSSLRKPKKPADEITVTNEGDKNSPETGLKNTVDADNLPKLYDTAMIDSIGKSNAAFTSKMITMFVDIISQDLDLLKNEADKENWGEVSQIAHKMKSTFGNMAVHSVLDNIKALEAGTTNPLINIKQLEDRTVNVISQIKTDYPDLFKIQ